MARHCLICGTALDGCTCSECGFDKSACVELFPTLMNSASIREALWVKRNAIFQKSRASLPFDAGRDGNEASTRSLRSASAGVEETPHTEIISRVLSDDTCAVVGLSAAVSGSIVIPKQINHRTVVGIEKRTAMMNTRIISLTLPDTVKWVGAMAFCGCHRLQKLKLPYMARLENGAFSKCISLNTVTYYSTPDTISEPEGAIDENVFSGHNKTFRIIAKENSAIAAFCAKNGIRLRIV